ncbi:MAG: hypothetical protein QW101_00985 [Ignisphaera sp.]|uniref:Uncharacterized protein n=1 Tax=Ignisphaera aggregans TaxID=334771 RepID=A0A7J3MWV9_9CREN
MLPIYICSPSYMWSIISKEVKEKIVKEVTKVFEILMYITMLSRSLFMTILERIKVLVKN